MCYNIDRESGEEVVGLKGGYTLILTRHRPPGTDHGGTPSYCGGVFNWLVRVK